MSNIRMLTGSAVAGLIVSLGLLSGTASASMTADGPEAAVSGQLLPVFEDGANVDEQPWG